MGLIKPTIESRQPESQASPLAGDVLDQLRRQIIGGQFGEGFGPQREAGTAIRQFVNSGGPQFDLPENFLQPTEFDFTIGDSSFKLPSIIDDFEQSAATGRSPITPPGTDVRDVGALGGIRDPNLGIQPSRLDEVVAALSDIQRRETESQVGDLREAFGIAGSRFGDPLARAESSLRGDLGSQFTAQLANLLEGGRRFDTQAGLEASRTGINRDVSAAQLGLAGQQLGVNRDLGLFDTLSRLAIEQGRLGLGSDELLLRALTEQGRLGLAGEELGLRRDIAQGQLGLGAAELFDRSALGRTGLAGNLFNQDAARLLQGINLLQNFGTQNLAPFFQLAQMGILPEQTIVGDSPLSSITGLLSGAGGLLTGLGPLGIGLFG